jgi:hypothetical protein
VTRSAQQPSTSPGARTESGPEGEATPAAALSPGSDGGPTGTRSGSEARTETAATSGSRSGSGEATAEAGEAAAEAQEAAQAAPAETAEPSEPAASDPGTGAATAARSDREAGDGAATGAAASARSEGEADPGAAAAAKSRLPALVRTMTETAIDRPRQQAAPVGRPGKAVLAGAAVAGALLVSVPFLVLGGNDDGDDRKKSVGAGTVLGEDGQEAPGEFVVASPDGSPSARTDKASGKPEKPVRNTPGPAADRDRGEDAPKKDTRTEDKPKSSAPDRQDAASGGGKPDSGNDRPANAGSGVTLSAPVSFRSHLSGRCVDVPDGDFSDGKQLWVWDCNNSPAQKWQFASDGTVRIGGKCLDVAGANYNDGTPIQIAWCSGNAAQKFTLNGSHDLVNTVVGKCVDIKDNNRGNGDGLQLWTCAGTDNQKWSV